jgi:hypothetical protein
MEDDGDKPELKKKRRKTPTSSSHGDMDPVLETKKTRSSSRTAMVWCQSKRNLPEGLMFILAAVDVEREEMGIYGWG